MFSVILYGRNDSHGYNLHKRAAISFNALAEVMSDPDDEILFVDYNTPDDHPTFPEAIHDTLTDKAKKVMRILRVRPEQHAHLRSQDPSGGARGAVAQRGAPALEPAQPLDPLHQHRHAAGAAQRAGSRSATSWAALPTASIRCRASRFPEMLWEAAFDRRDPAGNLAKLRDWAVRFHLNQVVHNYMPMKYDALGDFQAALREDMFAIHGFDEDMILGWHCDSNLAARLALYRGRVDTLIDKVFGYHCDHTRVAAANNKGRATRMNDQDRFIWNVASPYVPAQAETWGWPDVEIEELHLDRDTAYQRFTAGLDKAIKPATAPFTGTSLEWQLFEDLTYDLPHTLPFVCDQVVTFPRSTAVMMVAARADFVTGFAAGLEGHGLYRADSHPRGMRGIAGRPRGRRKSALRRAAAAGRHVHLRVRPAHPDGDRAGAGRPRHGAARQEAAEGRRKAVQAGGGKRSRDASGRRGRCRAASSASTSSTTSSGRPSPTMSGRTSTRSAARCWPACRARMNCSRARSCASAAATRSDGIGRHPSPPFARDLLREERQQ